MYRNTKSIDSAIRHLGKQYPPPALPRASARPPPFPPKHLILLVNSKNSEVGFRKHFILLVNPVNPVILHLLEYFFWPRARARGGIPTRDCRITGFTGFTSKIRCFRKPTTEFSEFTSKTSVSLFMFSKTPHFTCEF